METPGFEPGTSSMRNERSTPELRPHLNKNCNVINDDYCILINKIIKKMFPLRKMILNISKKRPFLCFLPFLFKNKEGRLGFSLILMCSLALVRVSLAALPH